jgi:hypothetical protein
LWRTNDPTRKTGAWGTRQELEMRSEYFTPSAARTKQAGLWLGLACRRRRPLPTQVGSSREGSGGSGGVGMKAVDAIWFRLNELCREGVYPPAVCMNIKGKGLREKEFVRL